LGAAIVGKLAPDGQMAVVTLDPALEAAYHESLRQIDGVTHLVLDPVKLEKLRQDATAALTAAAGNPIAIVCSQALRKPLHRTLHSMGVDIAVVAFPELPPHISLTPIGVIEHGETTHV
jgi:flagellar biosynthesis protein FlhA